MLFGVLFHTKRVLCMGWGSQWWRLTRTIAWICCHCSIHRWQSWRKLRSVHLRTSGISVKGGPTFHCRHPPEWSCSRSSPRDWEARYRTWLSLWRQSGHQCSKYQNVACYSDWRPFLWGTWIRITPLHHPSGKHLGHLRSQDWGTVGRANQRSSWKSDC